MQISEQGVISHNGAELWYKRSGPSDGPPLLFLHGGPGYNSYSFEHSIGHELETHLQMIYFDQRDCGRSKMNPEAPAGIQALVEDIEALRLKLGLPSLSLAGHSFGGLIALEYLQQYPNRVEKLILIEVTADLRAIVDYQFNHILSLAHRIFPDQEVQLREIAASSISPLDKLAAAHRAVDWFKLQTEIFWHKEESLYRNMFLDIRADIFKNPNQRMLLELKSSGYLEANHRHLMRKLPVPALLLGGRHSHCMGTQVLQRAAEDWDIPLVWFEHSGHMPFIEEAERFSQTLFEFLQVSLTATIDPRNNFVHEAKTIKK